MLNWAVVFLKAQKRVIIYLFVSFLFKYGKDKHLEMSVGMIQLEERLKYTGMRRENQ